jgi:serine/threonine-protein kinase
MSSSNVLLGSKLGVYEIISELGRGAMGEVYLARYPAIEQEVAIKVLPSVLARDKTYIKRFLLEGTIAAQLNHPSIVSVYEVKNTGDIYYIVMEYCKGETLAQLLVRKKHLRVERALAIIGHAAAALAQAHGRNIIHRDIKPENIMVTKRGKVKVMDFGLAKNFAGSTRLTATGMTIGTPQYMSPEQWRDQDIGPASDIYSLGIVLFELMTGRAPFVADSPFALMRKALDEPFPSAPELNENVSENVNQILRNMVGMDSKHRYASARDVLTDIESVLADAGAHIASVGPS